MTKILLIVVLLFGIATSASRLQDRQSNSACAQWCADNFPDSSGDCTSKAAHSQGPCYECGPKAPSGSTLTLCNGVCVDTSSDANNCGTCGNTCPTGIACTNGSCAPPDPYRCNSPSDPIFFCGDGFCQCGVGLDGHNICVERTCPSINCASDADCAPSGPESICVTIPEFGQNCCTFARTECATQ